jgi:hypothetical protein
MGNVKLLDVTVYGGTSCIGARVTVAGFTLSGNVRNDALIRGHGRFRFAQWDTGATLSVPLPLLLGATVRIGWPALPVTLARAVMLRFRRWLTGRRIERERIAAQRQAQRWIAARRWL